MTPAARSDPAETAALRPQLQLLSCNILAGGSVGSGFVNQTQYLAEAAEFPYWSHQANRKIAQFAASSNGLLTRIKPKEVLDYPLPGRIPGRGALWVRFGSGDAELVLVVAHLSLGPTAVSYTHLRAHE